MNRYQVRQASSRYFKRIAEEQRLRRIEEMSSLSVGSLSIDVQMARAHGWSAAQIDRVARQLGQLSRRNSAIAHRYGPPNNGRCPCVTCDPKLPDALLEDGGKRQRERWRRQNLWPHSPEGSR